MWDAAKELPWLDATTALRIAFLEDGHGGLWNVHADLVREGGAFVGVIMATHRRRPGAVTHSLAREVSIEATEVREVLVAFRAGVRTDEIAPPVRGNVITSDTSRTVRIQVDAIGERHPQAGEAPAAPHHVQFFVDAGQDTPQPWRLRGCEREVAFNARKDIEKAFVTFFVRLGSGSLRDAVLAGAGVTP